MRKSKIESRGRAGCIKIWTLHPFVILSAPLAVNTLRPAAVLDLVGRVVSISPVYLTDRWWLVR